ncbi:MAG: hypothetical protein U9R72_00710, partial [Chloroflexota bacterium]|nr:hypothetical protein [Chloroflexota bacterium]
MKKDSPKSKRGQKLTTADVLEIVERCRRGETQAAVARDFPISEQMIGRIMRGLNWSEVTGIEPHRPGYARGEDAANAKLTRSQVLEIVRRCETGERFSAVARDFPVGKSQVARIMRGAAWAHVTGIERGRGRPRGEELESAKLTRSDVVEIVRRYNGGETQTSIARDFPVGQSEVSAILRGKNWAHVTGI